MRIHTSIVAFTVCCLALVHVAAGADFATGGTSRTVSSAFCVDTTLQVADADTDGLPDWWEYAHDLNVMLDDAGADPDADGRTNRDELRWNGDPQVHDSDRPVVGLSPAFSLELAKTVLDTDGDGMPDAWEVAHGLPVAGASATNDADSDGICDLAEYNGGTDPCVADRWQDAMRDAPLALLDTAIFPVESTRDTDGDGMPDWWELRYGLSVELNDAGGDPDHDELSNLVEYHLGLDPTWDERCGVVTRDSALWLLRTRTAVVDADGDHLPAAWEIRHGFSDANPDDALSDDDEDGLTALDEYNAGTDPLSPNVWGGHTMFSHDLTVDTSDYAFDLRLDSDTDGMPDWWELKYGLRIDFDDSEENPDGDALTNLEEYNTGLDPRSYDVTRMRYEQSAVFIVDTGGFGTDTDGDQIPDWWERFYGGDVTNIDASVDSDGDGLINRDEYVAHCDPRDPSSVFAVRSVDTSASAEGWIVTWPTAADRHYHVFVGTNLPATWPLTPIYSVAGDGTPKSYTNTTVAARVYLRLEVDQTGD